VDVGKLPYHLKLCVMYSGSILSFNSPQRTEIQRAVRFDAVPILSEKIPPTHSLPVKRTELFIELELLNLKILFL
jgi:hypothetical protein